MSTINCPQCQREIPDQVAHCLYCGAAAATQNHGKTEHPGQPAYPGQPEYPGYPGQPEQPRPLHVSSLVLSIIGLVFSILLPIVTYPCSIVGLVKAVKNRTTHKTTAAFVMCIIGLVVAIANSAIGAFMGVQGMLF